MSTVFMGDIISATPSQPPDITITIKAHTQSTAKGDIVSKSRGEKAKLSDLARSTAKDLGVNLKFEAKDKQIANYSYTGAKLKEVDELGKAGAVNAYIDDDTLVVKDVDVPLNGKSQKLTKDTGMIGIPELTEYGVKVKYLYNNESAVGGRLEIESELNPAASGQYVIYKLGFDISNRDNQFYLVAEAKRL